MAAVRKQDINDAFWQKRILPEEDRRRLARLIHELGVKRLASVA